MKYITTVHGKEYIIEVEHDSPVVKVDGQEYQLDFQQMGAAGVVSLLLNNQSFEGAVHHTEEGWEVLLRGEVYQASVQDERAYRLAKARGELAADTGEVQLKSPMPGVIVTVPVTVGEEVKQGQTVIILESMKMQNELKASRDATVLAINVAAGQAVEKNQVLLVIGDKQ